MPGTRQHDCCKMSANHPETHQIVLHFAWTFLNAPILCCELCTLETGELKNDTSGYVQAIQSMLEKYKSPG